MTPERIKRHNDERLYQPKILGRRIRELHRISRKAGEPITVLVDRALHEFIQRRSPEDRQKHGRRDHDEQHGSSDTPKDQLGV
jgi:hypothetical protein